MKMSSSSAKPDPPDHGARMRKRLKARQLSSSQDQMRSKDGDFADLPPTMYDEEPVTMSAPKSSPVSAARLILWIILAILLGVGAYFGFHLF
jgi:hypothetical protein